MLRYVKQYKNVNSIYPTKISTLNPRNTWIMWMYIYSRSIYIHPMWILSTQILSISISNVRSKIHVDSMLLICSLSTLAAMWISRCFRRVLDCNYVLLDMICRTFCTTWIFFFADNNTQKITILYYLKNILVVR